MEPQDLGIPGALRLEGRVRSGRGLRGVGERSLHPGNSVIELVQPMIAGAAEKCGDIVSAHQYVRQEIRLHLLQECRVLDHIRHAALYTRHLQVWSGDVYTHIANGYTQLSECLYTYPDVYTCVSDGYTHR